MKSLEEIIEHVKSNHEKLRSYIATGIDNGYNIVLVHLTGPGALQKPNLLGVTNPEFYNARRYKDKILAEFDSKPGQYTYGVMLGKQPGGFYLICIEIDIDNECKEIARKKYEEFFQKYGISYHLETTLSGRYHIFFAVDKVSNKLKKLIELVSDCDAIKYLGGKPVKGEIRILGIDSPHLGTVYNGIANNWKPFYGKIRKFL